LNEFLGKIPESGAGGVNDVLPSGWINTTLEAVAIWSSGGTPSRSMPSFYQGAIPWFKTGELGGLYITDSEEKISLEAVASSSAKIFPKGSVILAMYGATIGKTSILGIDAATNQACAAGKPDTVDSLFLYYYLVSQTKGFIDAGKGGAQPNISQGIVRNWPIWVPPAAEQTRIVEKLEELLSDLDAGVAELMAAQKKLGQYRQSLLKAAVEGALTADWRESQTNQKTKSAESGAQLLKRILHERRTRWEAKQLAKFKEQGKTPAKGWQSKYVEPVAPETAGLKELPKGWVWASIDQIAYVGTGVTPLRSKMAYFDEGTIPWVTSGALNSETVTSANENVTELALTSCRLELYPVGTLLLAMYGEGKTRGKCAELLMPATINQAIAAIVLEPEAQSSKAYLKAFLLKSYEKMREQASGGVQPNLNLQIVKSICFPLPPIDEQAEINNLLHERFLQIKLQQTAIDTSLKQATAQRKNILKAAFSGQLVPQDPQDEPASVLLARIRKQRAERDKEPKASKTRSKTNKKLKV
jgi:type I restriction enzyme, S subunit